MSSVSNITLEPWTPGAPVAFHGLGVRMRSMSAADIDDALLERLRDPRVHSQLAFGNQVRLLTRDTFLDSLRRYDNRRSFFLAVFPEDGGQLLGFAIARTDAHMVSVVTFAVTDLSQWRRNVSAAGIHLLFEFLFGTVKVHKIATRVYSTNPTVIAALEQYGHKREGVLREAESDGKGGRRDIVLFGLFHSEFLAAKAVKPYVRDGARPDS